LLRALHRLPRMYEHATSSQVRCAVAGNVSIHRWRRVHRQCPASPLSRSCRPRLRRPRHPYRLVCLVGQRRRLCPTVLRDLCHLHIMLPFGYVSIFRHIPGSPGVPGGPTGASTILVVPFGPGVPFEPGVPAPPFAPGVPGGPAGPRLPPSASLPAVPGVPLAPFCPGAPASPAGPVGHSMQSDPPHGL
jgi:hypothetical protein